MGFLNINFKDFHCIKVLPANGIKSQGPSCSRLIPSAPEPHCSHEVSSPEVFIEFPLHSPSAFSTLLKMDFSITKWEHKAFHFNIFNENLSHHLCWFNCQYPKARSSVILKWRSTASSSKRKAMKCRIKAIPAANIQHPTTCQGALPWTECFYLSKRLPLGTGRGKHSPRWPMKAEKQVRAEQCFSNRKWKMPGKFFVNQQLLPITAVTAGTKAGN